jgi:peptide-methionine (S)-S-oxide reductase
VLLGKRKTAIVDRAGALPGRQQAMPVPERHEVLGTPLRPPFPEGVESAIFGMGCFWGAERLFWEAPGVYTTAVGYAGGYTPNPTYEEVCSELTGHAEVVLVAFWSGEPHALGDSAAHALGAADGVSADAPRATTSYDEMLRIFWEGHDPTQGMRQGNDTGTQYRSLILWRGSAQRERAEASLRAYQQQLAAAGHGEITTELAPAEGPTGTFYYAEGYHQQYLAKNPAGYCGLGGTGVSCPVGVGASLTAAEGSAGGEQ